MKKIFIIGPILAATALLAGCTSEIATHNTSAGEESFIVNMISHHQEAVDSASITLSGTTNAEIKALTQNIISAQTSEIAKMKTWFSLWYPNSTIQTEYMNMMPEMDSLTGEKLDTAFLEGMIHHHQGAIQMAQDVLTTDHHPEIDTLAHNIITTQSQEITQMQSLLKNMH